MTFFTEDIFSFAERNREIEKKKEKQKDVYKREMYQKDNKTDYRFQQDQRKLSNGTSYY